MTILNLEKWYCLLGTFLVNKHFNGGTCSYPSRSSSRSLRNLRDSIFSKLNACWKGIFMKIGGEKALLKGKPTLYVVHLVGTALFSLFLSSRAPRMLQGFNSGLALTDWCPGMASIFVVSLKIERGVFWVLENWIRKACYKLEQKSTW